MRVRSGPGVGLATAIVLAGLLAGCASAPGQVGRNNTGDFVGFRWRLVQVQHGGATVAVRRFHDYVEFASGGTFLAVNGGQNYNGAFETTGRGYRIDELGGTFAGSSSRTTNRAALLLGGGVYALIESHSDVRVDVHGDQAILTEGGYKVTCTRDGVARDS